MKKLAKISALTTAVVLGASTSAFAVVGDGTADSTIEPSEAAGHITDYALEYAPVVIALIGMLFGVGLTFALIRGGLRRARRMLRV